MISESLHRWGYVVIVPIFVSHRLLLPSSDAPRNVAAGLPRFAEKLQEFQDHIQCTELDHLRLVVFRGCSFEFFFFSEGYS